MEATCCWIKLFIILTACLLANVSLINCKQLHSLSKPRILNSTDAQPGKYPFVAAILVDNKYRCAGSIIDRNHILTTAICCRIAHLGKSEVWVGAHNLVVPEEHRQNIEIVKSDFHPDFSEEGGLYNDVCVITLKNYIRFVRHKHKLGNTSKVALPKKRQSFEHVTKITIASWGAVFLDNTPNCEYRYSIGGPLKVGHYDLLKTNKTTYGVETLVNDRGRLYLKHDVKNGPTFGDEGAPIIDYNYDVSRKPTLIGIESYVYRDVEHCPQRTATAVAINISHYIGWILEKVKDTNQPNCEEKPESSE